jgi:transposase InsO family protein
VKHRRSVAAVVDLAQDFSELVKRAKDRDLSMVNASTGTPQRMVKDAEAELVHHRRYRTRAEAARLSTEYIDLFYNRQRWQARLGYLSPVAYTQLCRQQPQAA